MTTIEIARRMAALGEREEAVRAYELVMHSSELPAERMEAALYVFQNEGDYKKAYTEFVRLYNEGYEREQLLHLLSQAFYEPNVRDMESRYKRNCRLLKKYPYLFRKDFLPFEELPLLFFPFDNKGGYVPFSPAENGFRNFVNVRDTVVSRNFFRNLEKPVLADDVYSQYELEYLVDNVRPSEWVARENHIYLHYTDWAEFCSWLQVINLRPVLVSRKIVFLIEDEISRYPIDFQKDFGVDYSCYTPRPVGLREIQKLIFHMQFSSHNGGDYFNEIYDGHPNLIVYTSVMFDDLEKAMAQVREGLSKSRNLEQAQYVFEEWHAPQVVAKLYNLKNLTDKDILTAIFLAKGYRPPDADDSARIVPAIFFQPHFGNVIYNLSMDDAGNTTLYSTQLESLRRSQAVRGFRYIKSFAPLRRPTTSHAASVRFMYNYHLEKVKDKDPGVVIDLLGERVTNHSFMRDPDDRLCHDSVIVRLEDAKLHPVASFHALCAFLDIPYTESMSYGSLFGVRNPFGSVAYGTNYENGFFLSAITNTYPEFANDAERYFIEYFLRDLYSYYGYDFQYYDGKPVDEERAIQLIDSFTTMDRYIRESWETLIKMKNIKLVNLNGQLAEALGEEHRGDADKVGAEALVDKILETVRDERLRVASILLRNPRFINREGKVLQMTPMLKPDPELMEQEA